jgi:ribose transport system ATP-binding protein
LRVEHLSFAPDPASEERSLHDISFSLRRGEILGVAGLMGSGRTELLEAIFGNHPHHQVSGSITIEGRPVHIASPQDALALGIALVTEDRKLKSLVIPLSVTENLTMSSLAKFCNMGVVRHRRERAAVGEMVRSLRIKIPGLTAPIESLSGGNQQKVVVGKCLLTKPGILLLDEPTRGIDVGAKAEIYALMSQFASQGMSIIMASSELPEVLAMCDRVLVLHDGRLAATFDQQEANQVNIMEAATGRPSNVAA